MSRGVRPLCAVGCGGVQLDFNDIRPRAIPVDAAAQRVAAERLASAEAWGLILDATHDALKLPGLPEADRLDLERSLEHLQQLAARRPRMSELRPLERDVPVAIARTS
jgi:hypothetical protein